MAIKITSKKDGFRRCGIAHSKEAVEYPDDKFSKEELKILKSEKMLVVEEIEDKPKKNKADQVKKVRPEDEAVAEKEILDAMTKVIETGENLISGDRPDVKAIETILGYQISAKERDDLMPKLKPSE